jgi:hypothetical protein
VIERGEEEEEEGAKEEGEKKRVTIHSGDDDGDHHDDDASDDSLMIMSSTTVLSVRSFHCRCGRSSPACGIHTHRLSPQVAIPTGTGPPTQPLQAELGLSMKALPQSWFSVM